ncbi:MAG: putative aromatic acid decarboxylase [Candidatus Heimdallarchaeota archaeon LC_2]|nr:MAG: putative aromatic acid decarboxylase [Candidatus Heimdallarchaeota archaeon LC_2]
MSQRVIIAISGASGVQYGLKLLTVLTELGKEVDLVISKGAHKVMGFELDFDPEPIINRATQIYEINDIGAKIASGTHPSEGMIIVPCSTKTLGAIANGFSQNLIHRAAECMLKEGRPLILVPRETPLSQIHLQNLLTVKAAGATILPASPGFYYKPKSVEDLIDFVVGKILNVLKIPHELFKPWDPEKAS